MPTRKTLTKPVQLPALIEKDGRAVADSRDIAAFFGRRHDDVLKAIKTLLDQEPSLAGRNFADCSYSTETSGRRSFPCFKLDRDGFTLLAMGFTGPEALKFKLRYIAAFNEMEARLRAAPAIDQQPSFAGLEVMAARFCRQPSPALEQPRMSKSNNITVRMGAASWSVTIHDAGPDVGPLHFDLRAMDRHQRGKFFGQFHSAYRRLHRDSNSSSKRRAAA